MNKRHLQFAVSIFMKELRYEVAILIILLIRDTKWWLYRRSRHGYR